jgi:hypothetical protein
MFLNCGLCKTLMKLIIEQSEFDNLRVLVGLDFFFDHPQLLQNLVILFLCELGLVELGRVELKLVEDLLVIMVQLLIMVLNFTDFLVELALQFSCLEADLLDLVLLEALDV